MKAVKMNLYIAWMDNGIDGGKPWTVVSKSLNGAKQIAARNHWAYVKGVEEVKVVYNEDGWFVEFVSGAKAKLENIPNLNRGKNGMNFKYMRSDIIKLIRG